MACERRELAAVSGSAPPSMSKSTLVSPYVSMTLPYAAASSSAEEQCSASSAAGRAAEGDPYVAALGPQRADLGGHLVVAEPGDPAPQRGAAAAGGDEGEVELLDAGLGRGVQQVVGGVEGGVDVRGEAGPGGRAAAVRAAGCARGFGVRWRRGPSVGVAVAVGSAGPVGRPLGSGVVPPSAEHAASLMRQPTGSAAVAAEVVTKPTVTDPPGARSLFQLAGFTVTWPPLTVCSPFQSESIFVPGGQVELERPARTGPSSVSFVTTYCPV